MCPCPSYCATRIVRQHAVCCSLPWLAWQIAELASSDASDEDLAVVLEQVITTRFLQAQEIPRNVTLSARNALNGLLDALKPGQYGKGRSAALFGMMAVAPNGKLHAPKDIS